MRTRILVVGRDVSGRARLSRLLAGAGYGVEIAESLAHARRGGAEGVALAVVVPDGLGPDGDMVARELGRATATPVLAISAAELADPIRQTALLTQVASSLQPPAHPDETMPALTFAGYVFDLSGHALADPAGRDIPLTQSEFALLKVFARRPGAVLSRDHLLQSFAGRDAEAFDRSIDMMVVRLRRKIEPDPKRPTLIVTVPGSGYKFAAKVRAAPPRDTAPPEPAGPQPRAAPVPAERRPIIALSAELVAGPRGELPDDPEDLAPSIDAFRQRFAAIVTARGAVVGPCFAREALGYFGYPSTHEDIAERAIAAGLALVGSTDGRDPALPPSLEVRVGIATGQVIVDAGGDLIGDAPSQSSALRATAEPGSVVVTASMRQLAGRAFVYRDLGPRSAGGAMTTASAWRVLSPTPGVGRFVARQEADSFTTLVGREEDFELLLRRWKQARDGNGKAVLISGEPGIGKSRLAYALVESVAGEPHARMQYFCSPQHGDDGLYPIVTQIGQAAGFSRGDSAETKFAKLDALLDLVATPDDDVAIFADLLAISDGGRLAPPQLSPHARRERIFAALLRYLVCVARNQPALVLVEDVQWIDPTSRDLMDRLLDLLDREPILLVVTSRSDVMPQWADSPAVTVIALKRLGPIETTALIDTVAHPHVLPREAADQISARADGIPLFIEELTRSVLEGGLSNGKAPTKLGLPITLQALLLERFDRLGPAKPIAQIGAAIGRTFKYDLLAAVHGDDAADLTDSLHALANSGLILTRGLPPESSYTFKHALIQDTAYGTMPAGRRRQIHARIVEVLEQQFQHVVASEPRAMAYYCTEAGLWRKAIEYLLRAGRQALARSALTEAARQLHQGLALLAHLPDDVDRWGCDLALQTALSTVLAASSGLAAVETGQAYARCRALSEHLGNSAALMSALTGQNNFYLARGDLAQTREVAKYMLQASDSSGVRSARMVSHRAMGTCLYFSGQFVAARPYFEKTLELYEEDRNDLIALTPLDQRASALSHLSWTLWMLGYADQAASLSRQAQAWARQLGHPHTLAQALTYAAQLHLLLSTTDMALLEELISLATVQGFPLWSQAARYFLAYALAVSGDVTEGVALAVRTDGERMATGFAINQTCFLALTSRIHGMAGRADEALAWLTRALVAVETTGERWFEPELHRLKGHWLLANRPTDWEEAQACFLRALDIARRQQARMWELRAATSLAGLWRGRGQSRDARDVLAPIHLWFTEGLGTTDLMAARDMLGELAVR